MKTINVTFDDEEFEQLEAVKKDTPWRIFILTLVHNKEEKC